jgi:hypothetical protein
VDSEENVNRLAAVGTAAQAVPARLIVCERTGRWAVALRRELAEAGVRVWETRTLDDCWSELAESPASFVVLELGSNVAGLLDRMARQPRQFPMARLAVVADRSLAEYDWLTREAGAVHFACSPRQVGTMAQLACRHLAQVPPPSQSLTDRIWAGLPWGERRGARGKYSSDDNSRELTAPGGEP